MARPVATSLSLAAGATAPGLADAQAAIDGCIDQMSVVGGPDAPNTPCAAALRFAFATNCRRFRACGAGSCGAGRCR